MFLFSLVLLATQLMVNANAIVRGSQDEGRHKGLGSKGEPIDEVWTERENIRL